MSARICPYEKYCARNGVCAWADGAVKAPIVFLPLMTKPAREVEKGTKYLPEMWKPNG